MTTTIIIVIIILASSLVHPGFWRDTLENLLTRLDRFLELEQKNGVNSIINIRW